MEIRQKWSLAIASAAMVLTPVSLVNAGDDSIPSPPPGRVPTYRFVPIGTLPGYERASVNDINNSTQVVGTAWRVVFGPNPIAERRAFVFENGVISDLGTSSSYSGAEGIADTGAVVGFDSFEGTTYSFFFAGNGIEQLMDSSEAVAVNCSHQVVIRSGVSYLWDNGALTNLGNLGASFAYTQATAINELGQVVGKSSAPWAMAPFFRDFAFLWEQGQIYQLPVLIDGPSDAYDINESGWIIGWSDGKPVLWANGQVYDLTLAPFNVYGTVWRANNFSYLVGTTGHPSPGYATVWHAGATHNLNNLVPPGTSWHLLRALAINDCGEIAGEGYPQEVPYWHQAFLLLPVDCDSDGDRQVTLADYTLWQSCLTGPGAVPGDGCQPLDFDRDGDVDLVDFRSLDLALDSSQ